MRWLVLGLLVLASSLTAAPLPVFDDDATPADGRLEGSRLALGGGADRGYRPLSPAEIGQAAKVAAGTTLPTVTGAGFDGSANCVQIQILPGDLGWWSAELPLPAATRAGIVNLRRPALVLAIRGGQGHEAVELGLTGGSPRVAVRIPLDRYGPIERQWTVYRVPLTDFTDLVPDLPLSQLQSVVLFSSRPGPATLEVDAVRFEPDSGPVGVRELPAGEAPPAQPVVKPAEPVVKPAEPVVKPAEPVQPVVTPAEPVAPVVPPTVPEQPVVRPAEPVQPVVTPAEPVAPVVPPTVPEQPVVKPAEPTPPAAGGDGVVVRPTVTEPGLEVPTPVTPAEPVREPTPAVAGPKPDAPGTAGQPVPVQPGDDLPPMLPVAFFFTDAAGGDEGWAASSLQATWSTNQGERGLDEVELKEHFLLAAGGRLPVVAVADPGRESSVIELHVKQAGFAWWVAKIGQPDWAPADLAAYLRNGRLELAIRGAVGDEALRIGVFDRQDPSQVALVPLSQFGAVTTSWQVIRIPLRALKAANPELDWGRVGGLQLASAHGRPMTIWLDDLRIVNPAGGE